MARDFAKQFYNSKKWQKARMMKISSEHGICERCGKAFNSRNLIVHHKVYLNETNIHDENISLNQENLECVCWTCHNREHNTKERERVINFDEDGNIIFVRDREDD